MIKIFCMFFLADSYRNCDNPPIITLEIAYNRIELIADILDKKIAIKTFRCS